ncbi:MAG: hypothetical protein AB1782_03355 [Cyanobacteriota bacterium]
MEIILDKEKSIFKMINEAFRLYFMNFFKFTRVMVFPIAAHLIGIPLIFLAAFGLPNLFELKFTIEHKEFVVACMIIACIPGFALFLKGFWAYLIAMVSLNRLAKGIIENDQGVTAKACSEYVNLRQKDYVYILSLMMLLWIVGFIIPLVPTLLGFVLPDSLTWLIWLLIIISGFISLILVLCLSVYFSLSFQVFAFEEIAVIDVFKKSFNLIDKNFFRTVVLLIILYIITGIIFPLVAHLTCELLGIVHILTGLILGFVDTVITQISHLEVQYSSPILQSINMALAFFQNPAAEISKTIIILTIDGVVTAGMLPFGTICFTLLYFDIINRKQLKEAHDNV